MPMSASDDLITLASFTAKSEFEAGAALAAKLRVGLVTDEERCVVGKCNGYCLIGLGKPFPAIEEFSEVLRIDATDPYVPTRKSHCSC